MRIAKFPAKVPLFAFLAVVFTFSGQTVAAETLIYDNSIEEGGYYPPGEGASGKLIDYGTSVGGNVTRFTFGIYTTSSPGMPIGWRLSLSLL